MKIAVVVCTYNRPAGLGHLVRAFELQDYADREMVILDDAGQYPSQSAVGPVGLRRGGCPRRLVPAFAGAPPARGLGPLPA